MLQTAPTAAKTDADFFDRLQAGTERFLTWRRRVRERKRAAQKAKNPVRDWAEAFIWAVCWVLVINQYLVQAYQIPSGSMIDTLLIGDHIFVNKIVYGPELLPGLGKLPSPVKPKRNDIIIFENPDYQSRGTAFDVAQRVVYMLTLSLVDIDRDENGQPRTHFLIKRAAGAGGDTFYNNRGDMDIRFAGETRAVAEREYNAARGFNHNLTRRIAPEEYPLLEAAAKVMAYARMGLDPPEALLERLEALSSGGGVTATALACYQTDLTFTAVMLETIRGALPHEDLYRSRLAQCQRWYVPEGRVLPLGDNRDNSKDGRWFGPVRQSRVLGQALVKYWPLGRIGGIR